MFRFIPVYLKPEIGRFLLGYWSAELIERIGSKIDD